MGVQYYKFFFWMKDDFVFVQIVDQNFDKSYSLNLYDDSGWVVWTNSFDVLLLLDFFDEILQV